MKFIIYYKTSKQISEDSWDVYTEMKEFNETTTLSEIREWWGKKNSQLSPRQYTKMFEINLQEID